MIGDPTSDKRCKIIDARNCPTCSCAYYVRYSGNGDYEIDPNLRNQCNVEKYEVTRAGGGPVYTSVASIHLNRVSYNPAGPRVSCVNSAQARCKENSPGWQRGIWNDDGYCCRDWKARFCCN